MKTRNTFAGLLFGLMSVGMVSLSAIAGGAPKPHSGYSHGGTPVHSPTQSNGASTGQNAGNGSIIHGSGNTVNQSNDQYSTTTQVNNIDNSVNSSSTSGSQSGSNSSNGLVQNTYSKVDGRQDGGSGTTILPTVYNNTNTFGEVYNICGVKLGHYGVTPLTNSLGGGFNVFGVAGANFASSRQKFEAAQKTIVRNIAQASSFNNAEMATFSNSPVLRKHFVAMALKRDLMADGMKEEIATQKAESMASEVGSGDIRATSEYCASIYQGKTSTPTPVVDSPVETPVAPPMVEIPGNN